MNFLKISKQLTPPPIKLIQNIYDNLFSHETSDYLHCQQISISPSQIEDGKIN